MNFEYIKKYYEVPAEFGRIVEIEGYGRGVIAADLGLYIGVLLDSDPPRIIRPLHPTSGVKYLGIGVVRKMSRSQKRYLKYINSEFPGTFAEFLGIKK